jgi:hypothetical protein
MKEAGRRVPVMERLHRALPRVNWPIGAMEEMTRHQLSDERGRDGRGGLELARE